MMTFLRRVLCRLDFHSERVLHEPRVQWPGESTVVECIHCHRRQAVVTLFSDHLTKRWIKQGRRA